jgi:general nucleoside transport system permease protein
MAEIEERLPVTAAVSAWTRNVVRSRLLISVVLGFALSFVVGGVLIALVGTNPAEALRVAIDGSVATRRGLGNTLVFATPRLLVGLGACVAIRSGVFNLGGEGQLQMGAVGAALVGVLIGPMVAPLHLFLAVAAAAAFGGLWALIAALLQVWRGASVLITTLLMNFVAIFFVEYLVQGPFQGATAAYNSSERIHETAELPVVLPGTRVHFGFVIALIAVALTSLLLQRTTLGTEFRAAGFNPRAARFAGLSPARLVLAAMFISGALGGLAGAGEILGVQFRLLQGFSTNIGFEGLAVAFLAGLDPIATLVVALLFGALQSGVLQLQHELGIPVSIALIMEGLPIVFLAASRGLSIVAAGRTGGTA